MAAGDNNYQASALTALPAIGLPGTGGRGTVLGGSVEASNVDIATEFTNLIMYQQGYEANAHVVTTDRSVEPGHHQPEAVEPIRSDDRARRDRATGRHPDAM